MSGAAQVPNGVTQVIPGKLIYLLALGFLRNHDERQANHIILTRNGMHPEFHAVDTSTTKLPFVSALSWNPQR